MADKQEKIEPNLKGVNNESGTKNRVRSSKTKKVIIQNEQKEADNRISMDGLAWQNRSLLTDNSRMQAQAFSTDNCDINFNNESDSVIYTKSDSAQSAKSDAKLKHDSPKDREAMLSNQWLLKIKNTRADKIIRGHCTKQNMLTSQKKRM